jgi:hypothetical protein
MGAAGRASGGDRSHDLTGPGGLGGLMLVDIARHAANDYAREGRDRDEVLARIRELFDAEWSAPTENVRDIPGM